MRKELLFGLAILGISQAAFTYAVRREIGKRDNWTCQNCGKSFQNGWMVQAAHYDHDPRKKKYNDPKNGRILCTECHIQDELDNGNKHTAALVRRTQTVYTYDRIKHPEKYGERPKRRVTR